jgi:tRNA pseudouridine38-40 synthase
MPRYKLTLAYDGTDFCGWQKQEPFAPVESDLCATRPSPAVLRAATPLPPREGEDRPRLALRTVQGVVERAVREVVREPVVVLGASRTDAGVHARGQVCAFSCTPFNGSPAPDSDEQADTACAGRTGWPLSRGLDRLTRAINGRLPDDVLVLAAEVVPPDFDPITHATAKAYSYTLHASPPPPRGAGLRPLFDRRFVHHIHENLDVPAMQAGAAMLVGEHDFAAFAAAGHGRLSTIRTIFSCTVQEFTPDDTAWLVPGALPGPAPFRRIRIDVCGNGFLWNMVRIIAGTLVDIGRGRKMPDDIPRILASGDRSMAGPTLPPTGLCLEWVRYNEP